MSAGGAHARTCARECTSALVQLWRARDQCTKSHSQECQVMAINIYLQVLLPEAVCCCLQTCTCGFDIRVALCTSIPSLI